MRYYEVYLHINKSYLLIIMIIIIRIPSYFHRQIKLTKFQIHDCVTGYIYLYVTG